MSSISSSSPTPNDLKQKAVVKVFPISYVNGKETKIGDLTVVVDKQNLPFSAFDKVDLFIKNAINYSKDSEKEPYSKSTDDLKKFNSKFFKVVNKDVDLFNPYKYKRKAAQTGGMNMRKTKSKKGIKNRTRKNYKRKTRRV
jgi:hypothetical protein